MGIIRDKFLKKTKVAVLGGGTGTMAVLGGLKKYHDLEITAIVGMSDDGGSNAMIRDEFGILPLSDLRKSIIALAPEDKNHLLRQLFTYRFDKGNGLRGHTLGNLIMTGLTEMIGSETEAIRAVSELFRLEGEVVPVTLTHTKLVADYESGVTVKSEHLIDESIGVDPSDRIINIFLEPKGEVYPPAATALVEADMIVAGPGDLYTTTIANLLVKGVSEAIKKSSGRLVFVTNLMTKAGETRGFALSDLVGEFTRYAKRSPDFVLVNNAPLSSATSLLYKEVGETSFLDDLSDNYFKVVREDLLSSKMVEKQKGDDLTRSLIRHDSDKLGQALYEILKK